MNNIYNFSAGPAMLPKKVMVQIKKDFLNWNNLGISVLELSHRNEYFFSFFKETKNNLKKLLFIPNNYEIIFCHGGARGQFSAIPMNLVQKNDKSDYFCSGFWSYYAAEEAKKYCSPNIIDITQEIDEQKSLIPMQNWPIHSHSEYIHYCPNETIEGIAIFEEPQFEKNKIIIGDFSSTILSQQINIQNYHLIYASAQKNIGIPGLTVVIINKELLKYRKNIVPSILDYNTLYMTQSMFNTPATFSWYVAGLMLEWLIESGGIKTIEKKNKKKALYLYDFIDKTDFYNNNIDKQYRSNMNIPFFIKKQNLTNLFLKKAEENNLFGLKGHNLIGGLRASLYNAMPLKGVKKLVDFMYQFEIDHR
ncbi:Phosphoserine aminotransferase [Buchnera aphidicola (Thelaxes suberi)]|uniref:3-phosphoserine/phosphohydroxythreonine transaminase n=1 Tax=Buchnera aphidicola TaxID=9 RepID=UPI0034648EAB